jgi:hypothetical protein
MLKIYQNQQQIQKRETYKVLPFTSKEIIGCGVVIVGAAVVSFTLGVGQ